jgi:VanZ family protein
VQLVVLYAPEAPGPAGGIAYADLVVHAAVFAAVGWTGRWAGVPVRVLSVALVANAVVSEVLQATALPGRSGQPADVVADLVGTAVGLLLPTSRGRRR